MKEKGRNVRVEQVAGLVELIKQILRKVLQWIDENCWKWRKYDWEYEKVLWYEDLRSECEVKWAEYSA